MLVKKFRYILIALILVGVMVFCTSPRCGKDKAKVPSAGPDSPVTETVPEVTEEPVIWSAREVSLCGKTFSTADRKLDLSNIRKADVAEACEVFADMPNLEYVAIGDETNDLTWEDLDQLYAAAPDARFNYGFTLYGQSLNTFDRVLDFNHYTMPDNAEGVKQILPYMRNCTTLDMDSCGISNEVMQSIREAYPDINVIWRIWFGYNYSVRTDVTKILASKPSVGGDITNEDAQVMKYCTNLKFLDLGHNEKLDDFSFISELKDLRVAVLSITALSDLTPLSNCKELYYLEAGNTDIVDLSPLAACTKLQHLNVGTCFELKDISPIYDLDLKRLWLGSGDPVPAEQVAKMRELHPGIEIDTTCPTGLEGGAIGANEGFVMGQWKTYKQYLYNDYQIREYTGSFPPQHPKAVFRVVFDGFEYVLNPACYSFPEYDPLYNPHESIYGSTRGEDVDFSEDPECGRVIYLTKDEEHLEAWQELASVYEKKTGVPVTIKTGESLDNALLDIDAPTMFEINGSVDLVNYADTCYDMAGSPVTGELTYSGYTCGDGGRILGIARDVTSYGILVNIPILESYGHSLEEIKDYESLKAVVADFTENRYVKSFSAAWVSAPMADITETGLSSRLVNIPIVEEFKHDGVGLKDKLDGTYLDQFHNFWDLYIYNMNCSYYDISPAAVIQRTNEDSCREFLAGDAVFFICGTEIWDYIQKDGRMAAEDIGFIPIFMGLDNEKNQGLCTGTDCYWSVNANSPENNISATVDFLNWLVTSKEGTEALAQMGYVIPYKNAAASDNPFVNKDREMTAAGKEPITWNYAAQPSESWKDEVNYEMAAYSANLGDWSDIFKEIVTVWTAEYAIK